MMNHYNKDIYFYTNELKLMLHDALMKRKAEGIHPCMMNFLSAWITQINICAYYNGDHIITELPGSYMSNEWLPLTEYGFDHIVSSFKNLNIYEISLLKAYFMEYELYDIKSKLVDKWVPSQH